MGLEEVRETIEQTAISCGRKPQEITLIVVSKGQPIEAILKAYDAGVRDFGENRTKELLEKREKAPKDIRWHFIGSLQRKKVKEIIGKCALVHSVDSVRLAQEISKRSLLAGVVTPILLEANISGEESKHGLSAEDWELQISDIQNLEGIKIEGLMTMAPMTEDEDLVRNCFAGLKALRDKLGLRHLSMGMTHDYTIAIEEGATLLRVGTAIFEEKR